MHVPILSYHGWGCSLFCFRPMKRHIRGPPLFPDLWQSKNSTGRLPDTVLPCNLMVAAGDVSWASHTQGVYHYLMFLDTRRERVDRETVTALHCTALQVQAGMQTSGVRLMHVYACMLYLVACLKKKEFEGAGLSFCCR